MISIALATYNGSKFIRKQLESILAQSMGNFEAIVCDDCSTDNTLQILQEYASKDSRFKIFKNQKNLGFKKNFEHIFSLCKGDYIACCDQDDIWEPNHLEVLYNNIGKNDCIGADALLVDADLTSLNKTLSQSMDVHIIPNTNIQLFNRECFYNLIQGTACLFSKRLLQYIIPFPKGIKFHDHWIALNACIHNGCKYKPQKILLYRCHSQNITGYKEFKLLHALQTIMQASKFRATIYQHNLAMLQAILPYITDKNQQNIAKDAIIFFKNLAENKKRFRSTLFYIKKYESITLCPRRKWKLFFYRVLCVLLFGIMQ